MAVSDAHLFPGFLTPVLLQLFFQKPQTTFLTCFCRGEMQKYARKKVCLKWGSNSQSPGHEYDSLTTEPPERGDFILDKCEVLHVGKGSQWMSYGVNYRGKIMDRIIT